MGLFGNKTRHEPATEPGAQYVNADAADSDLPVAQPVKAEILTVKADPGTQIQYGDGPSKAMLHNNDLSLPRRPTVLTSCPNCQKVHALTRIRTAPNWVTFLIVLVIASVLWNMEFGILWVVLISVIPLCVDVLKRTDHYCQSCNALVGSVRPMQGMCVKNRG